MGSRWHPSKGLMELKDEIVKLLASRLQMAKCHRSGRLPEWLLSMTGAAGRAGQVSHPLRGRRVVWGSEQQLEIGRTTLLSILPLPRL